jgi:hypothetical protein
MRSTTIPETTIIEDIGNLREIPNEFVEFTVGKKLPNGNWIVPQTFESFLITGQDYIELNGPPTSWAPDKPTGTYRNDDLWHYVDLQRAKS